MAVITISVNDDLNKKFREIVRRKLGERKGALGKAVEDALNKWLDEERQNEISREMIELMEEGVGTLGKWKFKRDELYGR